MDSGHRCGSPALHDRPLCYWHQRALTACKTPKAYSIVLEDYNTIQIAVTKVFNDLMAEKITPQLANAAFYGLALAQRNSKFVRGEFYSDVVTEPTPVARPLVIEPGTATSEPLSSKEEVDADEEPIQAVWEQVPSPAPTTGAHAVPPSLRFPPLAADEMLSPENRAMLKKIMRLGPKHPGFREAARLLDAHIARKSAG